MRHHNKDKKSSWMSVIADSGIYSPPWPQTWWQHQWWSLLSGCRRCRSAAAQIWREPARCHTTSTSQTCFSDLAHATMTYTIQHCQSHATLTISSVDNVPMPRQGLVWFHNDMIRLAKGEQLTLPYMHVNILWIQWSVYGWQVKLCLTSRCCPAWQLIRLIIAVLHDSLLLKCLTWL